MPTPPTPSPDVLGWARTAHYVTAVADDGDVQLRSDAGASTRYYVRRRGSDRLELTQTDDDGERPLLFVADIAVLERYLIGLFADDIREDLDLPFLELPYAATDLATGFTLSNMKRGYRTLTSTDQSRPIAAAPDPTLSLLTLVPLSHMLGWSITDLKRSFLNPAGTPLLGEDSYAPARLPHHKTR